MSEWAVPGKHPAPGEVRLLACVERDGKVWMIARQGTDIFAAEIDGGALAR